MSSNVDRLIALLSKIDMLSMKAIMEELNISAIDVHKALCQLKENNLIRVTADNQVHLCKGEKR